MDHREVKPLDGEIGGQRNEDAVDEEEVEGPEQIMHVEGGQAVTHRAEGRHQGGGDGHAGDHGALLLAGGLDDAGHTAEEGDQHIVDGRVGAGKQFGGILHRQRGDQEVGA